MNRDTLHVKAPGNWINDPNGFIYYKGRYHLFYQHFPYAPVWGTMHWGHAVSEDLVHWEHLPVAIFPSKIYDRNGIFSGSALVKEDKLYLYYSAVRYLEEHPDNIHVSPNDRFETSQAMIISKDGVQFDNFNGKRMIIPISSDEEAADKIHTRDPKVWQYKDSYYMALGSTLHGKQGKILFYKSEDAIAWSYLTSYQDERFGTILECPDLFPAGGGHVFLGSPMEIMKDGLEYSQHAVCAIADFEEVSCEIKTLGTFQFVDYGLDLYAPQTNVDKEGRRVMIAWIRMPQAVKANDRPDWNGMMCVPRVVEVRNGHIYFTVHPNVNECFSKVITDIKMIDYEKPFRLKVSLKPGEQLDIGGYKIWNKDDCIKTDRLEVFLGLKGYRMQSSTPKLYGKYELDIFVDSNLIEIFINEGQYVISQAVYQTKPYITGRIEKIYMEKLVQGE